MKDLRGHYENRTVAVIGARGYLGAALSEALKAGPARLLLVSRQKSQSALDVETMTADVRESACWTSIVGRADIILHIAGNTSTASAARHPREMMADTLLPVTHLIAAARTARRIPRVVFASTARVYGATAALPVNEDADTTPSSPFGAQNVAAEHVLAVASAEGIVEAVSLRLGNVYGPSPCRPSIHERNVVSRMTRQATRGESLPLYGDGSQVRDYVYVEDVTRAFLIAGVRAGIGGRSFNVASGQGTTVREMFHRIAERASQATGMTARVEEVPWPTGEAPAGRQDFIADIGRVAAACGWAPRIPLDDGLDRLVVQMAHETAAGHVAVSD